MKKEIVIYGASTLGKIAYLTLKEDYDILFLCDGDENKVGGSFDGVKIYGKGSLIFKQNINVIIASMYYKEIGKELLTIGINKVKIFNILKYIPNLNLKIEPLNIGEYIIEDYNSNKNEISSSDSIVFNKQIRCIKNEKAIVKIVFFSAPNGGDKFLDDIIRDISLIQTYEVKKMIVKNYSQIDETMEWADICWFEWCDGLIAYASNNEISKRKKIICRLHYYEVFTEIINQVNWNNVDNIIFVSNFVKDKFQKKLNLLDSNKFKVISNGINLDIFEYSAKEKGYKLAFLASIDLRKNPMIVIQYFYELWKNDSRYHLYFGGKITDELLEDYMKGIIKTLNMQENIHFDGEIQRKDLNEWFKDKHFIISGSVGEGHPVGIMEGMSCGLKPLIHYFPGVYDFYPKKYVYSSFSEFNIIINDEYISNEYREYIDSNFSLQSQMKAILDALK